jgi:formate-dependent nitrite reductase membrane component NrfD
MKPAEPWWGERTGEPVVLAFETPGLYEGTDYAAERRERGEPGALDGVAPGMMKPPVWTWEIPLYFWTGGIAAGSSFVALACDLSGDHRSARVARLVSLGALAPSPALLILDLGRPERFLHMLRIFKLRSPMSMGAWALSVFGALLSGAIAADRLERPRAARGLGAATAVVGGYLGSYTGVLLASTAVPLWSRSRLFLGPIFVATATATGAAAVNLVAPLKPLRQVQAGAMAVELALSVINERRLGELAAPLRHSRRMKAAKRLVNGGLALQALRADRVASALYLAAGLLFRYAWVEAGKVSARDDEAVSQAARDAASGRGGKTRGSD